MLNIAGLLTEKYTTAAALAAVGLKVGMIADVPNTAKKVMLVRNDASGATLAQYAAVKFKAGSATSYVVTATAGVTDLMLGVNDNYAGTILVGEYFWATIKGHCTVLMAAAVGADVAVAPSATGATLDAAAAGTVSNLNCQSTAASGAGGATAAYIH